MSDTSQPAPHPNVPRPEPRPCLRKGRGTAGFCDGLDDSMRSAAAPVTRVGHVERIGCQRMGWACWIE